MAKKTKVIVDITRETDGEAVKKTETVIDKMTENATTFSHPTVPINTMKTDKDDFVDKTNKAQYGGVDETLAKNKAREIVNSNYRQDGNYVNSVTDGDKTKALLSGYELAKERTKPVLDDFELLNTKDTGVILVYCREKPKGLIVKMLQYAYDPMQQEGWMSGGVTRKIKKQIKNLKPGLRVWVRLAIVVDEDIIEYCDPISIIVT
jgi:hypothetical protein